VFQLEEVIRIVERFLDQSEPHWADACKTILTSQ
jgi:hypothetical protein